MKNDEVCDGGVGRECDSDSMMSARVGELEISS